MLEQFQQYIQEHYLARNDQKLLLAVSGGIDSMVMMHLFSDLGKFNFAIAHCNFQLRGNESDEDQVFIKTYAEKFNKEFFTVNFNTQQYAAENRISIQMAARELRYTWFNKIATENQFDRVAVAHNQDDIVETLIINLTRGTGTKGLSGIQPSDGLIIRPLLFASRKDIETYAKQRNINFREDSSNAEVKYKRNLIRHRILPLFQQLNPSIRETLAQETEIFAATWDIYKKEIETLKKKSLSCKDDRYILSIAKLVELKISPPLLFDMLSEFEFSYSVIKDIFNSLHAEAGRRFFSSRFVLLKDRDTLIIEEIDESSAEETYQIEEDMNELHFPFHISLHKFVRNDDFIWPKIASTASFDLDKLNFPLTLRHWQDGDFFYPLGLRGKKKLSDFFIDEKIDLLGKKRIWLLTSGNDIVWVVGYRIDDRYKIKPQTRNIFMLELKT